jgi:hypothetical protein
VARRHGTGVPQDLANTTLVHAYLYYPPAERQWSFGNLTDEHDIVICRDNTIHGAYKLVVADFLLHLVLWLCIPAVPVLYEQRVGPTLHSEKAQLPPERTPAHPHICQLAPEVDGATEKKQSNSLSCRWEEDK